MSSKTTAPVIPHATLKALPALERAILTDPDLNADQRYMLWRIVDTARYLHSNDCVTPEDSVRDTLAHEVEVIASIENGRDWRGLKAIDLALTRAMFDEARDYLASLRRQTIAAVVEP